MVGHAQEARVGDRGAGDVSAEIFEGGGAGAGGLNMHAPVFAPDLRVHLPAVLLKEAVEVLAESALEVGLIDQELAVFDLGIRRLREVPHNLTARRREAQALAESSYPLRRMHRFPEARQRIEAAFTVLSEIAEYPAKMVLPDGEVAAALRARADYELETGERNRAVATYEELLAALMAAKPDPAGDLADAAKVSTMYYDMALVYRRVNNVARAQVMDAQRSRLWQDWNARRPHNAYVQRQLTIRSQ